MKTLLCLIVLPAMEEVLSDWLLMHHLVDGFTSSPASGHGSHHHLSISEQVSGQRKQTLFWIELEQENGATLIAELQQRFPNSQIHYWQLPLLAQGHLS